MENRTNDINLIETWLKENNWIKLESLIKNGTRQYFLKYKNLNFILKAFHDPCSYWEFYLSLKLESSGIKMEKNRVFIYNLKESLPNLINKFYEAALVLNS